jgi:hypothetical protein
LPLSAFANDWLQEASELHFGDSKALLASNTPFTLMTVVRGKNVDESAAIVDGDEIHRLLFGAAALRQNWRKADLTGTPFAKARVDTRSGGSPGDTVFAVKRGRAIWAPSSFTAAASAKPTQSCYHRNQVMGAMQVETLCNLAASLRNRIAKNPKLPARIDELGPVAVQVLLDIHKGDDRTYRSMSLRRQIEDRGSRDDIAALANRYGLSALS